ncbi:ChaN family lipoprotein [Donghicola sp. XS_ASV15]|uniref:ChaN family lipoprotein n=1 Tax=Donghicola sp. XS_ASV15 TaxID=3241295 RepID=UPI0035160483
MKRLFSALPFCAAIAPVQADEIRTQDLLHLPDAQVYVLGEFHDSAIHHENQAKAVEALSPTAMVFEMLTSKQVEAVGPEERQDQAFFEAATDWSQSGWPDLSLYWPIFAAAPDAVLYGGGVPREALREAFSEGAADVFGDDAARFGLDQPLPADQKSARESEQFDAHCGAMPLEMMGGMVAAQRVRDAALAKAALDALDQHGAPVVVITGNGHARTDWGAPAMMRLANADLSVFSLGQLEAAPEDAPPYDAWLVTDRTERGDPCAAFATTE